MKIDWTLNAGYLITSTFNFAALIATIITVRVTFKNRRNSMRENLYNRQLNLLQEIHTLTIELAIQLITVKNYNTLPRPKNLQTPEINDTIKNESLKWQNLYEKMQFAIMRAQLVVPNKIMDDLVEIYQHYGSLFIMISSEKFSDIDTAEAFQKTFELENIVRKFLHLEQLDKENRKVLSQITKTSKTL